MATKAKAAGEAIPYAMPDTYHDLVRRFPLARIRDDAHLAAAHEVIDRLLVEDLDDGGQEYLDALADHVSSYEDEHVKIPEASEAEVLRELMSANRLSQSRLAKEVEIAQSTISAVLAGNRSFTKAQVVRVAARFGLPTTVFLRG
jgi:HTH-type transcriptional regulator / antitoxin HigA